MHFSRRFSCFSSCLTLALCPALLSGCIDDFPASFEHAEDYGLNEIYMDFSVSSEMSLSDANAGQFPAEWDDGEGMVRAKIALHIRKKNGKEVPLKVADIGSLNIRYGDKSCTISEATHIGKIESTYYGHYYCYISHDDLPAGTLIEASYRHADGSMAATSVRWPGFISNINIREIVGTENESAGQENWFLLLTNDMTVSWTLPASGLPEAVQMRLTSPRTPSYSWFDPEGEPGTVYFENMLSGDSTGTAISKNTFTDMVSEILDGRLYYDDNMVAAGEPMTGSYYREMELFVSSVTTGAVSPLVSGGSTRVEMTTRQHITALPCAANDYNPDLNMWYCASDIKR